MLGSNSSFFQTNSLFCHSNSSSVILTFIMIWETILSETLTKMNASIDQIDFAVSCSAIVTDEFELLLTKTGEAEWQCFKINRPKTKLRRALTIRTFQSVREEIENTFIIFLLIEVHHHWRGDENGRENLHVHKNHVRQFARNGVWFG